MQVSSSTLFHQIFVDVFNKVKNLNAKKEQTSLDSFFVQPLRRTKVKIVKPVPEPSPAPTQSNPDPNQFQGD